MRGDSPSFRQVIVNQSKNSDELVLRLAKLFCSDHRRKRYSNDRFLGEDNMDCGRR
jgi:hypothetical protein